MHYLHIQNKFIRMLLRNVVKGMKINNSSCKLFNYMPHFIPAHTSILSQNNVHKLNKGTTPEFIIGLMKKPVRTANRLRYEWGAIGKPFSGTAVCRHKLVFLSTDICLPSVDTLLLSKFYNGCRRCSQPRPVLQITATSCKSPLCLLFSCLNSRIQVYNSLVCHSRWSYTVFISRIQINYILHGNLQQSVVTCQMKLPTILSCTSQTAEH
jgi:hypothetical protein